MNPPCTSSEHRLGEHRLGEDALARFLRLREEAVTSLSERFYATFPEIYARYGERGRDACREDLGYVLDFLRPVLELGLFGPFADSLRWLARVLAARGLPAEHVPLALAWLAELFDERLPPEEARVVRAALEAGRGALEASDAAPAIPALPGRWVQTPDFERALVGGDRRRSGEIFREAMDTTGKGFVDAEVHLAQPALYDIGREWQENRVSVAQEHLATAITQTLLAREFARVEPAPPNGRKVVLACVPGNHHSLGLRMVSDAFELAGWDVRFLGADTPVPSLVALVRGERPDLVGLSVALPHQLAAAREAIAGLNALAERPAVMIGGYAINQFDGLADALGADVTAADAKESVQAAEAAMGA